MKPSFSKWKRPSRGKRGVIEHILAALLAEGHILLDDMPGVGKTALAVALSRAVDLRYRRVQFTPDVMPSDIVGFSVYEPQSGQFVYHEGAATHANLLLGDEINRTSSKTQSALLEAMEERQVTRGRADISAGKTLCRHRDAEQRRHRRARSVSPTRR